MRQERDLVRCFENLLLVVLLELSELLLAPSKLAKLEFCLHVLLVAIELDSLACNVNDGFRGEPTEAKLT